MVPEDRGQGLLSTAIAIPLVLFFMLFCAQLLIYLHAVSVITSLSHDAASTVARSVGAGAVVDTTTSEQVLRDRLGELGDDAEITWNINEEAASRVRIHVRTDSPSVLPSVMTRRMGLRSIDRVVTVRLEEPRP